MKPGGIADKLGNRYEAKWTVYKLLQVASGAYDSICVEGIDERFVGFEFVLSSERGEEWHQCKINAPNGNWTIGALGRENILETFKQRLAFDPRCQCVFVSQDNARDLRDLSEEARFAGDAEQFRSTLADKKSENFDRLIGIWNVGTPQAFDFLNRITVTVFPEKEVSEAIVQLANHLVQIEETPFPQLRDFLEQNLNRTVLTEGVREWIDKQPTMKFKSWVNRATVLQEIDAATTLYLESYTPFGVNGYRIERSQTAEILGNLGPGSSTCLVLVTGAAGAGKSGVLRQVIEDLRDADIPVLGFRIDRYLDIPTARALGTAILSRNETLTSTLKGVASGKRPVLIIDQLDAVSEVSGRDGRVKDAVFELVREATLFGEIDLVIACRTFDLENDERVRSLQNRLGMKTAKVDVRALDWDGEIKPALEYLGLKPDKIRPEQRALLTSPVNLAVFGEIGDPDFSFQSRTQLFSRLTEKKQRLLAKEARRWGLLDALSAVSTWMSDRQLLSAPRSLLDRFDGAREWLLSEGLLVESGGQVGFFHESYFDFVYARSFANTGKTVHALLTSAEQHLFRRTQVRQILTLLREADFNEYYRQLNEVILAVDVRYHVKLAIAQWASSIENLLPDELAIFLKLDDGRKAFNPVVRHAILTTSLSFLLLESIGLVRREMSSPVDQRKRLVFHWLSNIAGEHPAKISELLREWWDGDPTKAEELVDWFGFVRQNKPDNELLKLCLDVITSKPANLFVEDGRDRLMMLMHSWVEHDPEMCAVIVDCLFTVWHEVHPHENLADRDKNPLLDSYPLGELAKKSPKAFVEGTASAIFRTVKQIADDGESGHHWHRIASRYRSPSISGFEGLLVHFEHCLASIARSDPDLCRVVLGRFLPNIHTRFIGIHLTAVAANPDVFGPLLLDLFSCDELLEAGWHGAEWKLFASAVRAVLNAHPKLISPIEGFVLSIWPEFEDVKRVLAIIREEGESKWCSRDYAVHRLNNSGFKQWCILKVVGQEFLTADGLRRLQELDRKFHKHAIPDEQEIKMREVEPPIARKACERMSDQNWLSAIRKHAGDDQRHYRDGSVFGGSRHLSNELQEQATRDPDRFLRLFERIPLEASQQYFRGLLTGVAQAESPDKDLVANAIGYAFKHFPQELDYQVLDVIERHPDLVLICRVRDVLFAFARHGRDPAISKNENAPTDRKMLSVEDIVRSGERLVLRSAHGGRAKAWDTLERCLWHCGELMQPTWDLIFERASVEPSVAVRSSIFHAMTPLFNDDKNKYRHAIHVLLDTSNLAEGEPDPLQILGTWYGAKMYRYIGFHLPELTEQLIERMLVSEDSALGLIGAWWLYCESFRDGRNQERASEIANLSEQHRVLYADVLADAYEWTELRNLSEQWLIELFSDPSADVRKQVSEVFRGAAKEDFRPFIRLAEKYIETPAFLEGSFALLHALKDATCDVSALIVKAAERMLESIVEKGDQNGARGTNLHQLQELLKREYVSSERRPDVRTRILDTIDFMLEKDIYGADTILAANDR